MAKFTIKDVWFLKSRDALIVVGDINDGIIKMGMKFRLKGNEFTIEGIDFSDRNLRSTIVSQVGLTITPQNKSFFDSILGDNNEIEIEIK